MAHAIDTLSLSKSAEPSRTSLLRRRMLGHYGLMFGIVVLGAIVAVALAGPFVVAYDPYTQNLMARMKPPFWMAGTHPDHILGADHLGRDYLARLIFGARISLAIGLVAAVISGLIGTALGVAAG
jgi:peptide/nickel transport system permease protein